MSSSSPAIDQIHDPANDLGSEMSLGSASDSSNSAISARNVGKCYHIYSKPRDRLKQAAFGRVRQFYREFWALHDVSFDIAPGEALGIVGRNGSGKSTLLQIIAGTLRPTEGQVHVRGRIAALLELGSGFNPEFTGRENVFLQGAILGIPRKEMERRFDSIVEFADIGAFIDQPVKHYSSGMYARLAFSVAVSVDPDILIVDEILAVGDMGFQQRCIARMRKLLDGGVTLLLVSHSSDNIKSLCQKGLFLADGRPRFFGSAEEAVDRYVQYVRDEANRKAGAASLTNGSTSTSVSVPATPGEAAAALRYGTHDAIIESVRTVDADGLAVEAYRFGEPIRIELGIRILRPVEHLDVHFVVRDSTGVDLFGTGTGDEGVQFPALDPGTTLTVSFEAENNLRPGAYGIAVTLVQASAEILGGITVDHASSAAAFAVAADPRRPIKYKLHQAVQVRWQQRQPVAEGAAAASHSPHEPVAVADP